IAKAETLKAQQVAKLETYLRTLSANVQNTLTSINEIIAEECITTANKVNAILWSVLHGHLDLSEVEEFLLAMTDKKDTHYRRLLCAYDYKKYGAE
ncbi:SIR2 family protein, partial [Vibrio metschnikovii]|nr:SIR2 family protein [Vibrio metschnikovii]